MANGTSGKLSRRWRRYPAYILRQSGEDLQNTKRLVWKDVQDVCAEYQKALEERSA